MPPSPPGCPEQAEHPQQHTDTPAGALRAGTFHFSLIFPPNSLLLLARQGSAPPPRCGWGRAGAAAAAPRPAGSLPPGPGKERSRRGKAEGERSERFYLLLFLSSPELAAEEQEEEQQQEEAAPGRRVRHRHPQPLPPPVARRHLPPARRPLASSGQSTCGTAAHLPAALIGLGSRPIASPSGRGGSWEM